MKIEYTYREPEDRPIERASFMSSGGAHVDVDAANKSSNYPAVIYIGDKQASFSPADWHDFTALVNRIDRQLRQVPADA
jgi:hypothetical protein